MNQEIKKLQEDLYEHSIYKKINSMPRLRYFMHCHVFAVWDFMSIAKRLQNDLTCLSLPWTPAKDSNSARLINEIILYEESDVSESQTIYSSHLELYLEGMKEIGADTNQFNKFINCLEITNDIKSSFEKISIPNYVKRFTIENIQIAKEENTATVASNFVYGREDSIPTMFENILNNWTINEETAPRMTHYLKRHIHLDSNEHGPAAQKMLSNIIGNSIKLKSDAIKAAINALDSRISLWDGITNDLEHIT